MGGEKREDKGGGHIMRAGRREGGEGGKERGREEGERMLCCSVKFLLKHFYCSKGPCICLYVNTTWHQLLVYIINKQIFFAGVK